MPALLLVIPLVAVGALLADEALHGQGKAWYKAFAVVLRNGPFITFTGVAGLYPNLIPSSLDPVLEPHDLQLVLQHQYTLKIMTVVAFIFVPIVIAYKIWVYRIFRARVTVEDVIKKERAY